jgi:hypothetical protein
MESATTVIHRRRGGTLAVPCLGGHAAEASSGVATVVGGGEAA